MAVRFHVVFLSVLLLGAVTVQQCVSCPWSSKVDSRAGHGCCKQTPAKDHCGKPTPQPVKDCPDQHVKQDLQKTDSGAHVAPVLTLRETPVLATPAKPLHRARLARPFRSEGPPDVYLLNASLLI